MFGVSMIFHSYGGHLILVKNETTILPLPAKSAKILIYDFEDLLKHTRVQLCTDLDIRIGCEFIWIPFPRIIFCLCKVDKVAISGNQISGIKPWLRWWLVLMLIFVIWFIFTISMCSVFLLMNNLVLHHCRFSGMLRW